MMRLFTVEEGVASVMVGKVRSGRHLEQTGNYFAAQFSVQGSVQRICIFFETATFQAWT